MSQDLPAILRVADILRHARLNGMKTPAPERISREGEREKLLGPNYKPLPKPEPPPTDTK